jgi:hypothetical protein
MAPRRSEYDVTNRINTTDPQAVSAEVSRIFMELYPDASGDTLGRAFEDASRLYRGEYHGYRPCDTAYHNLQHTLDVTLAMARLMDGYERSRERAEPIGARLFGFALITALFHDIGYLRHWHDTRHDNGAEYTLRHVSRGGRFLEQYMSEIGMPDLAILAARIIHFTGYEMPVEQIQVPNLMFRRLGNMLGTADIMAQMADRCYLEKCRDRLYPEFVAGGLAASDTDKHSSPSCFTSPEDLLRKTPNFYRTAIHRLNESLASAHRYVETHFGGQNLYLEEVTKNIKHAERLADSNSNIYRFLRRTPPPAIAFRAVRRSGREVAAACLRPRATVSI